MYKKSMNDKTLEIMESIIMAEVKNVINNKELSLTNLRLLVRQCLRDVKDMDKITTKDSEYIKTYPK